MIPAPTLYADGSGTDAILVNIQNSPLPVTVEGPNPLPVIVTP
jgi:hypothetical protein